MSRSHLSLSFAFVASLCACQGNIGGDPDRGELLHSLALSSARAFSLPEVREEFATAIRRQDVVEGKIRLSEVMSGRSLDGLLGLDEMKIALLAEEQSFPALLSAFPEDIDFYIPIKEQRESFTADKEVIFVIADPELEDADEDLEAYDIEGNKLFLSRDVLPSLTVIAVGPSEQGGQAGLEESAFSLLPEPSLTEEYQQLSRVGGATARTAQTTCGERAHADGDAEILQDFLIRNAREFWLFGAPEIYLKMAFPNGEQGSFALNGGSIDVNDTSKLYPVNLPLFRWDRDIFAQDVLFRVIESDGGWSADLTVRANVQIPGGIGGVDVDFTTTIQHMDDDMGIQFVRFDDPCGSLYSTGDADWSLYYQP